MKIPIISLAVFVACFELPGCTNAGSLPSNQPDNFLLVLSEKEFFNIQYPTQDENIKNIGKEDFTDTSQTDYSYTDMAFSCANNSIYLLKSTPYDDSSADHHTLDVINFDENNELKTITHVNGIFDHAQSITSDWATGKIYWTVFSDRKSSIKVIDKSFKQLKYIIQPNAKTYMGKLLVYPRRNELFFLSGFELWYTFNSPHSNASSLFVSNIQYIFDFTIDYATDKLYIIESFEDTTILKRFDIGTSVRPLNSYDGNKIETISIFITKLVAFNNKIYWTILENLVEKLYFKNGNESTVELTKLSSNSILSFVSSSCPSIPSHASSEACFGQSRCAKGRSFQFNQPEHSLSALSEKEFFNVQYLSKNVNIKIIGIENFTNTSQSYNLYDDMTFDCTNNSIYVLKNDLYFTYIAAHYPLDVINFDGNKLKTVNHVKDIFDRAISITSDWTTGKIYWAVSSDGKFSIKVIDESFKKIEFIIQPSAQPSMIKLLVYPKRDELFFSSGSTGLWYTSDSPNSSAKKLFDYKKDIQLILDFTIDYATDKLYVIQVFKGTTVLRCIDIGTYVRPLNPNGVYTIETVHPITTRLKVAFNNKIYWTSFKGKVEKLYFKNGNETTVKVTKLSENSIVDSSM